MFSAMVVLKRKPSWGTNATRYRSEENLTVGRSERRRSRLALLGLEQPGHQLGEGGLARPGFSNHSHPSPAGISTITLRSMSGPEG